MGANTCEADTTGQFRYMIDAAESSLVRNGKVLTRRNREGSDAEWQGVDLESTPMPVANARLLSGGDAPTLQRNGFELLQRPLDDDGLDFFDNDQVLRRYYPQCEKIIQQACGARLVKAFDHNIRSAGGKKKKQTIDGGQQVQGPAHVVHGDYTLTSAPQRLRDLAKPPKENDTISPLLDDGESLLDEQAVEAAIASGRFGIVNLWRSIAGEPVATNPLAVCDAALVAPEDLVVFEIHYADRIGENYFAKHSSRHRWLYYPAMVRDEALLIKQWDSSGQLAKTDGREADSSNADAPCTFSFHTAFKDPTTPRDAPDRWSIEVRCMLLYP